MRTVKKDERKYYEALVQNSIQRLMLYPYHLADMIVKGKFFIVLLILKTRNAITDYLQLPTWRKFFSYIEKKA